MNRDTHPSKSFAALFYRAYLLRIWREARGSHLPEGVWRFSLEDVSGGKRRGFPTLEALVDYLKLQMEQDKSRKA